MQSKSRAATLLVAAILAGLSASATAQQDYPKRPIRIISPYAPGGGNTIMARLVGDQLTQAWGQQVIIDNRPGGNTIIGTELAARATPDGYTFLLAGGAHVLVPLVFKAPFDPIADFAGIGGVGKYEYILVGSPKLPANDLQQLIALARAKPEQVTYATFGAGTTTHLSMELFGNMVGARMNHIPFKGTGPALTALLGGHVDVFLSTAAPVVPHLQAGRLKGIAISGDKRSEVVPNVPTFAEGGLPGFEARGWYGVVAPAKTPKAIVAKASEVLVRAMATPEMKARLNTMAVEPLIATSEQFEALMRSDHAKWRKVLATGAIKLEH